MSAEIRAEARIKAAIKSYEEEVGVQVAGNAALEQVFSAVHKIYLFLETLGERKFRKILPHA